MKLNILFDLDGTLVDTSKGIYKSFSNACWEVNAIPPTYIEFLPLIGPPVQHILSKLYPSMDRKDTLKAVQIFRQSYDNINYRDFTWYPGAIEVLIDLSLRPGLSMALVTNKPTDPARRIIDTSGLDHVFDDIYGIDFLEFSGIGNKFPSKAAGIAFALSQVSSISVHNLYVGDTPSDQYASQQNSITFIAALYGFHQWNGQQEYSISSISDLPPLVSRFITP